MQRSCDHSMGNGRPARTTNAWSKFAHELVQISNSLCPSQADPDLRNEICCGAFMLVSGRSQSGPQSKAIRALRRYGNGEGQLIQGTRPGGRRADR